MITAIYKWRRDLDVRPKPLTGSGATLTGAPPHVQTLLFSAVFLSCAVLAGTCWAKAQTVEAGQLPILNGTNPWGHGWGFGRKVFKSSKPGVQKRTAALDDMAHVHAVVQGCLDIEIAHENLERLSATDGLGPLSPSELSFVGGRISDYKESLPAQAGEEICEWAYETARTASGKKNSSVQGSSLVPGRSVLAVLTRPPVCRACPHTHHCHHLLSPPSPAELVSPLCPRVVRPSPEQLATLLTEQRSPIVPRPGPC
jgi:hypothetical protein